VNTVMNFRGALTMGNVLTSRETISFSKDSTLGSLLDTVKNKTGMSQAVCSVYGGNLKETDLFWEPSV
jgi:hypothetical protein